jgi:hypothetical protein
MRFWGQQQPQLAAWLLPDFASGRKFSWLALFVTLRLYIKVARPVGSEVGLLADSHTVLLNLTPLSV